MHQRSWRGLVLAFALTSLVLASLPLAGADHAYSHRYIVYGRVVDAENNPVPGLTVDLGYEAPFTAEGPCGNQPGTETQAFGPTRNQPVTNQFGEFIFCFHTHSLSRGTPGTGIVRIESHNVEQRVDFDGFMRYSFVPVKLDTVVATANQTANEQFYTVLGRAWEASDTEVRVESIGVWGDTLHNMPFNVTIAIDGREPEVVSGTTNTYGDFAVRIPVESRPTGGTVTLSMEGKEFKDGGVAPIDGELGVTHIRGQVGDLKTTPGAPLLALLALVAIAAALARRK